MTKSESFGTMTSVLVGELWFRKFSVVKQASDTAPISKFEYFHLYFASTLTYI